MSVNSRRYSVRLCASLLAFVLVWMSGIAVLRHSDGCEASVNLHAPPAKASVPTRPAGPDLCAACAWVDAINVYLPTIALPPSHLPFAFESLTPTPARTGVPLILSFVTRGPPSVS